MRIYEIDYASAIPPLKLSQEEIDQAAQVGTVDQQPVYLIDDSAHVFAFMKDNHKLASYIVISSHDQNGYHDLSRMQNINGPKGSITALMAFMHGEFGVKFRIPAHEPLTWDGLTWLLKIIQRGRGFHIHDPAGNPIDIHTLDAEWNQARLTGRVGPTEILISQITHKKQIFETWSGALQPAYRYLHDAEDV